MKQSVHLTIAAILTTLAISTPVLAKEVKFNTSKLQVSTDNKDTVVVNQLDSTQEVAYNCLANGRPEKLSVMYGIKNGEIVVAQAKVANAISTGLWRVPNSSMNVFESKQADGTIWTTLPATVKTLHSVDGGVLSLRKNGTNAVVLEKCQLDKVATAKLVK